MKIWTLMLAALGFSLSAGGQEYSNKGKEFWIGYGNHEQMFSTDGQGMDIYLTSEVNTTALVEIPGVGFSQNVSITANQVTTVTIPNSAALDAEGQSNKGIHILAQRAIVVYAHIYFQSVSGASLCLPVNTLGTEYYSINYTQVAQSTLNANSLSYFFVVATESNTKVEINPTAVTRGGRPAGVPFTVTLNRGEVYQVLASNDLTGSSVRSLNNGTGCKRIAVFSGSGRIGIGCDNSVSSSDNLIQQVYPTDTWGKKYITVPSANRPRNIYRIIRPDAGTSVWLNGALIPSASFVKNFYYEFENTQTNLIVSDKPVQVAQYFTTQSCGENVPYGDPEMIFLNPVEQTINDVTLASMRLINPNNNYHFLNVVLPNSAEAKNSFKIDGVPFTSFSVLPQDPVFAYAQIPMTPGTHRVTCKLGFNAIAYGYAQFESYGYSAGTNLRDLYQFISVNNTYATVNFPAGCRASPLRFSIVFPFRPNQIQWQFNGLFPDTTLLNPNYDSTWQINGKTVYQYRLNRDYLFKDTGIYPVSVLVNNPSVDDCNGQQIIDYDLQIFERPTADFGILSKGCLTDSVLFSDRTILTGGRPINRWSWNFGDGALDTIQNPFHRYNSSGVYNVGFSVITDVGCLSDTIVKPLSIGEPPNASFTVSNPLCVDKPVRFTDTSAVNALSIAKWTWDYGDGKKETVADNSPREHLYSATGSYKVRLQVETPGGCLSGWYEQTVTISPNPIADFQVPDICLPSGKALFSNSSSIVDSTENLFLYHWRFGDSQSTQTNPDTSLLRDPIHYFNSMGPYQVSLTVISGKGCQSGISKTVSNINSQPLIDYLAPPSVCAGDSVRLDLQANARTGELFKSLFIDRGNGSFDTTIQDPSGNAILLYMKTLQPGNVTARVFGQTQKGCYSDTLSKTIVVNGLPEARFEIPYPACENQILQVRDASISNDGNLVNWHWDLGDGTLINRNDTSGVIHSYLQTGTYTIRLQVETDKGCVSSTMSSQIKVTALPVPGFSLAAVCVRDLARFTDSSRIADGTESQFLYSWDFGDGSGSTQKNPQHQYPQPGNYPVTMQVTSGSGCRVSLTSNVIINGNNPVAAFSLPGGNEICSQDSLVLINQSALDTGTLTRLEIYWDQAGSPADKTIDTSPLAGEQYAHIYPAVSGALPKTYQVRLIAYSGNNCFTEKIQTVQINPLPVLDFAAIDPVCANAFPFDLVQAREINNLSGIRIFTGDGIMNDKRFDPSLAGSGDHTIQFQFVSEAGCPAVISQVIRVLPLPVINAGQDQTILEGGSVILSPYIRDPDVAIGWSPATGLDNPGKRNPVASPVQDMTYILTVTSSGGCSASDDVNVKILKKPFIPNTFTPNGDGINDVWEIPHLSSYPGCIVEVYNPQGQLLFRSVGYQRPWDGTRNGQALPVGTYYYVIDPHNGRSKTAGYVTIIR